MKDINQDKSLGLTVKDLEQAAQSLGRRFKYTAFNSVLGKVRMVEIVIDPKESTEDCEKMYSHIHGEKEYSAKDLLSFSVLHYTFTTADIVSGDYAEMAGNGVCRPQ